MAKRRNHLATKDAVVRVCEALLFKVHPPLSREKPEDRFILNSALDELVWKYSEASQYGGKYFGCVWWSQGALDKLAADRPVIKNHIAFEHVTPRDYIIRQLAQAKDVTEVRDILEKIETCVVLREEHKKVETPKERPE